ncbi:MAG TPA: peroxidase-related enzyme [Aestuariivirga sp.]|jgi:uncharacterized peroxidase-related enzyme|nr:peroxidase-related enzyme [Aestuariivirga sp.]
MSKVVHEFTVKLPYWAPHVTPVALETASQEQLDAMKVTPSNKKVSEYVLTLAHDPESLAVRSPLFNAIMYGQDGLAHAERELGALGTSIVNRCVYCVAVHSARYIQLTKRAEVVKRIFADETEAQLDDYSQGIFDFSAALARTPPEVTDRHRRNLQDFGFDTLQMVDLVLAASIFAWANRLMHVLGEPIEK